jgi:hypothetical protein
MNKSFLTGLLFAAALSTAACAPFQSTDAPASPDLVPPVLVKAVAAAADRIVLEFDESPSLAPDSLELKPDLSVSAHEVRDKTIVLTTAGAQAVGREYMLRLTVADAAGNSAWLIVRLYGFNPAPPRLLINEFITQGSATHPDLVEVRVMTGGNLGGLCFCSGTADINKYRFVFPPRLVATGDFILLHLKPQNLPVEIDETGAIDASGGLDASPVAYDFWVKDGSGLSGNNGVLSLYTQPDGALIDAVLYCNRASDSDTEYRGFGSADLMAQADELCAAGGWQAQGAKVAPEDAVNPTGSTATRSLCRSSGSADANGKSDFHIVPTKKSSFGRENSDEVYQP